MNKNRTLRKWLFVLLMVVLSLPMINHELGIIESANLLGDVHLEADTVFTLSTWLSGDYQQKKEKYLNDNTGFHADFVRGNNELDFRLFKKLHARGVVLGKDHYLFEGGYISAYYGTDYRGDSTLQSQLTKLRYIQDTLERAGTQLTIAFTPSKARFYPEYLPDGFSQPRPDGKTNYEMMKKMCTAMGIHFIDLNGYYRSLKQHEPGRLFAKLGTHWTYYGADLAADTFNKYLGKLIGKKIPDIKITGTHCGEKPRNIDRDIADGLNLIWPLEDEQLCYHTLEFDEDSSRTQKPDVVFISDSFFWVLLSEDIPQHCYNTWQSWFYFNDAWISRAPRQEAHSEPIASLDWMSELRHKDALVLMYTESNLTDFGNSFIDQAYEKLQRK